MKRKLYEPVMDGEWIKPFRRGYRMKCCDCGLVHNFNFRVQSGRVIFQAFRNKRATAAGRRKRR